MLKRATILDLRRLNEKKWEKLYFLKDINNYTLYITLIAGRGKKEHVNALLM